MRVAATSTTALVTCQGANDNRGPAANSVPPEAIRAPPS